MSTKNINEICQRLSLRPPQRESLEILGRLCDEVPMVKNRDLPAQLQRVRELYPKVVSFDRDFMSLCFALATGVGKTRLMGAFITYLHREKGVQNFMVMAPNLTIYNKLIADFTPNTPKYVFQGIAEFAVNAPLLVTGDNFETGKGVMVELFSGIVINIFNISKITARDGGHYADDDPNKQLSRFRRLREEIGDSYYNYLAALDDLAVLMDESHRYRADAGMEAINELKPILGIELTATPFVERGTRKQMPFGNVIYEYPLANAIRDGFVKIPAVAGRSDFDSSLYSKEALEKLKLEDAIRVHENTKRDLTLYALKEQKAYVKPFVLVVAEDTTHAGEIQHLLESSNFFDGEYSGKVITIHSKISKGAEGDDIVQQLLTVENPTNPIEIVIHVNMLKEGWDVTNLYTIVPLRAANSLTLVEQSIGRGLRLPYGRRTGIDEVDRLTVISHDRFNDIVAHSRNPNSLIQKTVIIDPSAQRPEGNTVTAPSRAENIIRDNGSQENGPASADAADYTQVVNTPDRRRVAEDVFDLLGEMEGIDSSSALSTPEVQARILSAVNERRAETGRLPLENIEDTMEVIRAVVKIVSDNTIDIPRVIIVPSKDLVQGYRAFELDVSSIRQQPLDQAIMVQELQSGENTTIEARATVHTEHRPENYIIKWLCTYDSIDYGKHAVLINELAEQCVVQLRRYLKSEAEVLNVARDSGKSYAGLIYHQMDRNYYEEASGYEYRLHRGFQRLMPLHFNGKVQQVSTYQSSQCSQIRGLIFEGFSKCVYNQQKFDSQSELDFARILEQDANVAKWMKPANRQFQINLRDGTNYNPDFVVETSDAKYICEPKQAREMMVQDVLEKRDATVKWCKGATECTAGVGGKPWYYVLIPHDAILPCATLAGLIARYKQV